MGLVTFINHVLQILSHNSFKVLTVILITQFLIQIKFPPHLFTDGFKFSCSKLNEALSSGKKKRPVKRPSNQVNCTTLH